MKKKNKYVSFVLCVITCMAIWDLFDYVIMVFIEKTPFAFSMADHVVYPGVVAAVLGIILYLRD